MKWLIKFFRKRIIKALIDEMRDDDVKKRVVLSVSRAIDTSRLSEDQEAEVVSSLYDAIETVVVGIVASGRD